MPDKVLQLNRSLYGLKQAAATWFKTIFKAFGEMRFTQCTSDSFIFVRQDFKSWIFVALYVDDMLIDGKTVRSIKTIANELSTHFKFQLSEKFDLFLVLKLSTIKIYDK